MDAALLPDRGVVKVAGDDARKFLNGLLTADLAKVTPEQAAFAALLTPQGKIMVDMIVAEAPAEDSGGFFLACPRALAPPRAGRPALRGEPVRCASHRARCPARRPRFQLQRRIPARSRHGSAQRHRFREGL